MNHLQLLLIEDNPADARLFQLVLGELESVDCVIASSLAAGLQKNTEQTFDIILVDLTLPDSHGLETLTQILAVAHTIPIIVLTGLTDEIVGTEAIKQGAQDYLVKGEYDSHILSRSIRYAIERQHLLEELHISHQREQEARELISVQQLSRISQPTVTEQAFGVLSLQESAPKFFDSLVQNFEEILDKSLEKRIVRMEYNVENELRRMAEKLGHVKAGPRDVIDIYLNALAGVSQNAPPQKKQAYAEEGRLIVLGLMGNLVSFYRRYFNSRVREPDAGIDTKR